MKLSQSDRKLFGSTFLLRACICSFAMATSTISFAQVEVLEVMYNATDDNIWEWIEVRNTGGSAINLNGYLGFNLGDADLTDPNPTIDSGIDPDTTINPGEIAIIYDGFYGTGNANNFVDQRFRDAWGLGAGVKVIGAQFFPALTNTVGAQGQSIGFWATDAAWKMDQTPVEDDPINMPGVFTNRTSSFTNAAFSLDFSGATFPTVDGVSSITWTGNGSNQVGNNWVQSVSGTNGAVTSVLTQVPGTINSSNDVGNPGLVPSGTPTFVSPLGIQITEIMYDPASNPDNSWEWVEVYNSSASTINLAGWVLDDANSIAVSAANITSGSIPAGGTAILFNSTTSSANFAAAWGASLNIIPVAEWNDLALNNDTDTVSLWTNFANYSGDHQFSVTGHANAEVTQTYDEANGFPTLSGGPSISIADLSFDPSDGSNWDNAVFGDSIGSFNATGVVGGGGMITFHPGGDVGSPGSFTVVPGGTPGDFDGDSDVDGRDFLAWQRGGSPVPFSAADLATWQGAYNGGLLSAVSVPEPTSLAILALALVPLACGRKR